MGLAASQATEASPLGESVPAEIVELRLRIQGQPREIREELEPLINDVLENALFRQRAMHLAQEALQRLRLDLAATEFDLEATRREREWYRRQASTE